MTAETRLFPLPGAVRDDAAVAAWFGAGDDPLHALAGHWFAVMKASGGDVREILHDGQPTACLGEAAFGYVAAFTAHVNLGFFNGAALPDPGGLLQGTGRFMRHVKLRPGQAVDEAALRALIAAAVDQAKSGGPTG